MGAAMQGWCRFNNLSSSQSSIDLHQGIDFTTMEQSSPFPKIGELLLFNHASSLLNVKSVFL
jgi:hypothetical protein